MARKKKVTEEKIIEWYMNSVSNSEKPESVSYLAKENNFAEEDFYTYYSSFKDLEKSIFGIFANETIRLLSETEAYHKYEPKDKLLSYYFTFFELLAANKEYVLIQLKGENSVFYNISILKYVRNSFIKFINDIGIEKLDFKNEQINKVQDKTFAELYWIQMLMILKFWIHDKSLNFEKTDIFIEKSVKASFDLQQIAPVKSVIDLAKFLLKEKGIKI